MLMSNDSYFYGQIVGEVADDRRIQRNGNQYGRNGNAYGSFCTNSNLTWTRMQDGKICKIELSGGTLGTPWVAKNYTTPLTYNTGNGTNISAAIDSHDCEDRFTRKVGDNRRVDACLYFSRRHVV